MTKATQHPTRSRRYWLMKSEPDVFSFNDLKARGPTRWDGVRNYMARNFMMRDMQAGDLVLFYHSNANPSGVAGIARVSAAAEPDESAFDAKSDYFDAKSTRERPRWFCVEVVHEEDLPRTVTLDEIKKIARLKNMVLLHNSRLSVQPVTEDEFRTICNLAAKHDRPKSSSRGNK